MVQFKAITPNAEVSGDAILAMLEGLGTFKNYALKILEDKGIFNAKRDHWYSQQTWLDAFKVITEKVGLNALYAIGLKIPENAKWPSGLDSIENGLASIDIAYHMNHRINDKVLYNPDTDVMKEGIGHYGFELISERKIKMVCDNPYPCDFDHGIITNTARIFKPKGISFLKIEHDDSAPCRKKGDNSCTYLITW